MQYAIIGKTITPENILRWFDKRKSKLCMVYVFLENKFWRCSEGTLTNANYTITAKQEDAGGYLTVEYVPSGETFTMWLRSDYSDSICLEDKFACSIVGRRWSNKATTWIIIFDGDLLDMLYLESMRSMVDFDRALLLACKKAVTNDTSI